MKKYILVSCLILLTNGCKERVIIMPGERNNDQIIADHSIVGDFVKIPSYYIEEVKKMIVAFPGESHSEAYREGLLLLQSHHPEFKSRLFTTEDSTEGSLRIYDGKPVGEAEWFTWHAYGSKEKPSESDYIKKLISDSNGSSNPIHAIGFAWCWDLYASRSRITLNLDRITGRVSIRRDPEHGVYWKGASIGGPDGNREWGLDSDDYKNTGNRVSLSSYIQATVEYEKFCKDNGYVTKIVYTTGPADFFTGESGYQGFLKHQAIRKFVKEDSSRILFDYNDILCYDNDGSQTTTSWRGHVYPVITPTNSGDGRIGHISAEGAIRLAKAQWWMLARIAGWDGN
jgi:hypothetical protein